MSRSNRHHPAFHTSPSNMSEVDIIEMVCDWTAMEQEFGQPDGSARTFADRTFGSRLQLTAGQQRLEYRTIKRLEAVQ